MYSPEMCEQIEIVYHGWYEESISFWGRCDKKKEIKHENLQEFFEDLFKEFVKDDTIEIIMLKTAIFKAFQSYLCIFIGCNSLEECSLSELGSFIPFPWSDEEFPGGYTKLVEYLAARLPKDSIKLDHAVDRVFVEGESVIVECKN
jgi:hypothetical protein